MSVDIVQVRQQYIQTVSRLIIYKAASEGLRLLFERNFQRDLKRIYDAWLKDIAKQLEQSGYLHTVVLHAQQLRNEGLSLKEILSIAENRVKHELAPKFDSWLHSTYETTLQRYIYKWDLKFFDLGAVSALKSMGFQAEARSLDKHEISKAEPSRKEPLVFELGDKEIQDGMFNRSIEVGEDLTKEMLNDIQKTIIKEVYQGGKDLYATSLAISDELDISNWRAQRIGRTEAQAAFNTAVYRMFQRSGVKRHAWVTVGDDRVRETHITNEEAGFIPVGAAFPNGATQPGDGPDSINCRCSLEADLADPNLLLEPWLGGEE